MKLLIGYNIREAIDAAKEQGWERVNNTTFRDGGHTIKIVANAREIQGSPHDLVRTRGALDRKDWPDCYKAARAAVISLHAVQNR